METNITILRHLVIILFLWTSCSNPKQAKTKEDVRPNILLIIGESHRADAIGVAGNPFVQTPNLDKMANEGIWFSQAFVTTAICSVSRASILSGQHRARHRINDFKTNFTEEAFENTLPMLLKKSGYYIGNIGYFGIGQKPPLEKYDHWVSGLPWISENGIHNTDNIVQKTVNWLEKYDQKVPFYLSLSFSAAHEIDPTDEKPAHYLIQDRYIDLYDDLEIPRPLTADPKYWESFPDFFRTDMNIARKRWYGFLSSDKLFQENAKNYYRLISGLDDAVGKIRKKLETLGLAQNTIIIYTTDHGFSLGEHGLMGKWYGFDVGIHIPLIIYDPRNLKDRGIQESSIALNIDIAPTILSLVGLPIPNSMQGMNLIDVVKEKSPIREHFFYEHTVFETPIMPKVEGVVSKKFRYMNYIEHDYEVLYDFERDPYETVNLVGDPEYDDILSEMRHLYKIERANVR